MSKGCVVLVDGNSGVQHARHFINCTTTIPMICRLVTLFIRSTHNLTHVCADMEKEARSQFRIQCDTVDRKGTGVTRR